MAYKKNIACIAALAAVILYCCKASSLAPTPIDETLAREKWNDATIARLSEGYHLYIDKCGGCHYLHRPTEYSEEKWKKEMPEMAERAYLSGPQQELVLRYILTKRESLLSKK